MCICFYFNCLIPWHLPFAETCRWQRRHYFIVRSCWREVCHYIRFLIFSVPIIRKPVHMLIFLSLFWKSSIWLWISQVRQFRPCNSVLWETKGGCLGRNGQQSSHLRDSDIYWNLPRITYLTKLALSEMYTVAHCRKWIPAFLISPLTTQLNIPILLQWEFTFLREMFF